MHITIYHVKITIYLKSKLRFVWTRYVF